MKKAMKFEKLSITPWRAERIPVTDIDKVVKEINKHRLAVFSVYETRRRINLQRGGITKMRLTDKVNNRS